MKAIVLVGGEGTRLRPLTETIPKPLLPLVDRPLLHHVLDQLAEHGVDEVVLSSPYLEATFEPFVSSREAGPRITWVTEATPLGTAGAILNALHLVERTFLVLNGDVLTDLDLTALVAFHRERRAAATIALTPVADARPYGLVETTDDGRVVGFHEKPADTVPGNINAGTYVLERDALSPWQPGAMLSIEREVYPSLIESGSAVHGFVSHAYWLDLGTPERYLQAHFDLLSGRVKRRHYPAPYLAPTARVHLRARLGTLVVAGEEVGVAADAEVDRSVLHPAAVVEEGARVEGSILGPGSRVGPKATVIGSVLAEGATVRDGARLEHSRVAPGEVAGVP